MENEKIVNNKFVSYLIVKFPWLKQFLGFSMVGVINMVLSYSIYAILIRFNVHHQIANQIAFWLSVINGFVLNKNVVFKSTKSQKIKSESIKYTAVYGFNWILGIFLLYLYIDVLKINSYFAPLISIPITIPMNYALNKFWVFNNKGD